jgi:hypothetical protein
MGAMCDWNELIGNNGSIKLYSIHDFYTLMPNQKSLFPYV